MLTSEEADTWKSSDPCIPSNSPQQRPQGIMNIYKKMPSRYRSTQSYSYATFICMQVDPPTSDHERYGSSLTGSQYPPFAPLPPVPPVRPWLAHISNRITTIVNMGDTYLHTLHCSSPPSSLVECLDYPYSRSSERSQSLLLGIRTGIGKNARGTIWPPSSLHSRPSYICPIDSRTSYEAERY